MSNSSKKLNVPVFTSTKQSTLMIWASRFAALCATLAFIPFCCAEETYSFGILPQRTPLLTAQYWNPILDWISRRSGVPLDIKIAQTGGLSGEAVKNGEYDFVYSNHQFKPSARSQGYSVILRKDTPDIFGAIVVMDNSSVKTVKDLTGKTIAFANQNGFTGYTVQMDYFTQQGIQVIPAFGGNQDGALGQLKLGSAEAAGVNTSILESYQAREKVNFRVIWKSKPFRDLAISAHIRVPKKVIASIRQAFVDIDSDPEGRKILEASAHFTGESTPPKFLLATQNDYKAYLDFYRHNQFHGAD